MLPTMVDEELEELNGWRFVQYGDVSSLNGKLSEVANGGNTFKVYWKYKGIMCASFPVTWALQNFLPYRTILTLPVKEQLSVVPFDWNFK